MTQGTGDIELIYFLAIRDGYDYNLMYISSDFKEEPRKRFDPDYIKTLFDLGCDLARRGYPWQKIPPRLKDPERNP